MNGQQKNPKNSLVSIVLPCLNEESSIPYCMEQLRETVKKFAAAGFSSEIIVVDNGSTDGSAALLEKYRNNFPELTVANEMKKGYGSAYMKGFAVCHGEYICMADMDGTYDFQEMPKFVAKLKEGYGKNYGLVVGNRFGTERGEKKSMPWHHRHIGNPFLSWLVRFFFGVKIHDMHCGMRALTREAAATIAPRTTGMEFASEMIIKAAKRKIPMAEIAISYKKRIGESKLRSFADGWRHFRFILIYSPLALFFIPGIFLFAVGLAGMLILYFSSPKIFGVQFYFHPMFLASAMMIVGYQFIFFGGFARVYAATHLGDSSRTLERLFTYVTIEKACIAGFAVAIAGILIYAHIFTEWIGSGFGSLDEIKNSIAALTFVVLGFETVSSAFMLSILGIKEK